MCVLVFLRALCWLIRVALSSLKWLRSALACKLKNRLVHVSLSLSLLVFPISIAMRKRERGMSEEIFPVLVSVFQLVCLELNDSDKMCFTLLKCFPFFTNSGYCILILCN